MPSDLLKESIAQAAEEHGFILPPECISDIVAAVDMCRELDSYLTGGYCPQKEEISRLKAALDRERGKAICESCKGSGWITTQGPYHGSSSSCVHCGGVGFVY